MATPPQSLCVPRRKFKTILARTTEMGHLHDRILSSLPSLKQLIRQIMPKYFRPSLHRHYFLYNVFTASLPSGSNDVLRHVSEIMPNKDSPPPKEIL